MVYLSGILIIFLSFVMAKNSNAEPARYEQELSGKGWNLWLDQDADWVNDELHLPPVDISSLPANPPSCGWDRLSKMATKTVAVPGTVEEYHWGRNDNPNGLAGDYRGVSWWSRTFELDQSLEGKRITLAFESVNMRAEVYINGRLTGYDVIGNTPFECEIGHTLQYGEENRLDIRITDPGGTFSWNDENLLHWGNTLVPSVHGFGGITGKIILRANDNITISDIYVQNQHNPKKVMTEVTIDNHSTTSVNGTLRLSIKDADNPHISVWNKSVELSVPSDGITTSFDAHVPKAKLWNIGEGKLYVAEATFISDDETKTDAMSRNFGFRWFDVGEKDGDKRFYLNGKRVFILAAMTRGFWPKNGIFPTAEYARKDMELAVRMGFNMMLYHRAIGQPPSLDVADEMGVLTYEEPGGYLCRPAPSEFAQAWRKEKLRRMVIRDRSRPSMVIYNIDDLSLDIPNAMDEENMRMVHELDPSRIVTYNCIIAPKIPAVPNDPMKLRMLPFDDSFHYYGWTCPYHLINRGVYLDSYYENPRYYMRNVIDPVAVMGDSIHPMDKGEIIFLGEEGALGALVQLEKIKHELVKGNADGWRESEHLDWYNSFEQFLDNSGFRTVFPTVDDFTRAIGENMHYFHGRLLENVRISNKGDAYVLNGWASAATRSCFADVYRNPTADLAIFDHYIQPLYLAVKLRDKVLPTGSTATADIFIINESDIRGKHTLSLSLLSPDGDIVFSDKRTVTVSGGENFGQLIAENIRLPLLAENGHYTLKAELLNRKGEIVTDGFDDIFSVDLSRPVTLSRKTAVIDTSGVIQSYLKDSHKLVLPEYDPADWDVDCLIIGRHEFNKVVALGRNKNTRSYDPITEKIMNGMTVIVLDQADIWAERIMRGDYTAVKYGGASHLGNRGRFFAGDSNIFKGLPSKEVMNWEYQTLYDTDVWGLKFPADEVTTHVGLANVGSDEIVTALTEIRFGNGRIILSTLNILPELESEEHQSAVVKKLFINMLENAGK